MEEPGVLDEFFFDPSAPYLDFSVDNLDFSVDDLDFSVDDLDFSVDDLLHLPDGHDLLSLDAYPPHDPNVYASSSSSRPPDQSPGSSSAAAAAPAPPSPDSGLSSTPGVTTPEIKPTIGSKRKKGIDAASHDEEKRRARLVRNRESAQLSRQRRKHYVEELEEKVRAMHSTIADLNSRISRAAAENAALRHQLAAAGNAVPPPPPAAVYHPPPMHFTWPPFSGYAVRPNGAHVPLIPIPRLKPQQPAPAPKPKKAGSKKAASKTKKVASVSLLGLLFIMLVCGVNLKYGGDGDSFSGRSPGRVLSVSGRGNNGLNATNEIGLCDDKLEFGNGGFNLASGKRCQTGVRPSMNSSEQLRAMLYVPRNGKLVKISGNLIIHSVMASEKAMAHVSSMAQSSEVRHSLEESGVETGLEVRGNVASALAVPSDRRAAEKHSNVKRSLGEDTFGGSYKSSPAEGPLQQWFHEGLAGPVLSSEMCTEVFRFDISPVSTSPSGIIPATPIINSTSANSTNDKFPHPVKVNNRRILYRQLIPITGSTPNDTDHFGEPSSKGHNFHGSKSSSSMVVSVLADPRDHGDGDGDGDGMMSSAKSLSRIFVVVLLDSVKYVTYSCVLPLKSSNPHLVN